MFLGGIRSSVHVEETLEVLHQCQLALFALPVWSWKQSTQLLRERERARESNQSILPSYKQVAIWWIMTEMRHVQEGAAAKLTREAYKVRKEQK